MGDLWFKSKILVGIFNVVDVSLISSLDPTLDSCCWHTWGKKLLATTLQLFFVCRRDSVWRASDVAHTTSASPGPRKTSWDIFRLVWKKPPLSARIEPV